MLTELRPQPADKILSLMQAFREDPRTDKIDLTVGVYKNASGVTPVMRAVKTAEQRLVDEQITKAYTGLAGDPAFATALRGLILGDAVAADRVAAVATPGGTGAIRQAMELVKMATPGATVWLSAPTWPNHPSIVKTVGLAARDYRYFDRASGTVDFDGMTADLGSVAKGDIVLLHGCCHNPTGANLTTGQWDKVIDIVKARGAIALVDIAYQGFGQGLADDAVGVRKVVAGLPQVLIAASCSKNFGVYRERTGLLMAVSPDAAATPTVQGTLNFLNRQNYSFPPDHGARVVTMILDDPALRADWEAELSEARNNMLALRQHLADELRQRSNSDRFDFVGRHRGMFSLLGLSPEQVQRLRDDHGIYMVGDSRINIAGLNAATVPILAAAVVSVL